jgi:hypothetical protein
MGHLDRRHQMANVNDLESALLKVGNPFLVGVVTEERSVLPARSRRLAAQEQRGPTSRLTKRGTPHREAAATFGLPLFCAGAKP